MKARIKVLYEDNHLLVIVKPAGIATQGTRDEPSVVTWAREYLREKYHKPGNVYVGVVSRLDKTVSGVLVLARTSKAAARLSEQFRQSTVKKFYLAVVQGSPRQAAPRNGATSRSDANSRDQAWHECTDWMVKSERSQRMVVVPRKSTQAVQAKLRWQWLQSKADQSLLRVELLTGRKHQIRLQLAHLGCPIVGDRKYGQASIESGVPRKSAGSPSRKTPSHRSPAGSARIALHAERLIFKHPVRDEMMEFDAPVPSWWNSLAPWS